MLSLAARDTTSLTASLRTTCASGSASSPTLSTPGRSRGRRGGAWHSSAGARYVEIEVVCSDPLEHRHRVETRTADIDDFRLPSWDDVVNRDYRLWDDEHITLDTAGQAADESFASLVLALGDQASTP